MLVLDAGKMVGLITLKEVLRGPHSQGAALLTARCGHIMKVNPRSPISDTVDHLRSLIELHITMCRC